MAKAKATKKAGKKKATKKKGPAKRSAAKPTGKRKKAKITAKPGGPDIGPTSKLADLARFAASNDDFRKLASRKTEFQAEFKREKDKTDSPLKDLELDDQEIGFCEGWILLCENEFRGKYYDKKVQIAILEALNGPSFGPSKLAG